MSESKDNSSDNISIIVNKSTVNNVSISLSDVTKKESKNKSHEESTANKLLCETFENVEKKFDQNDVIIVNDHKDKSTISILNSISGFLSLTFFPKSIRITSPTKAFNSGDV